MVFKIISSNTSASGLNIVPYIGENGILWTANGLDSDDAGRNMNGEMERGLIGYKAKCNVSCLWMNKSEAGALMRAIMPEFITVVTDTIPWENGTVSLTMYSNNIAAKCLTEYTDGNKLYGDVEFPLVEK